MDTLFLKLLNISITASWIVLAVIAVRFLIKKAPKFITCFLWIFVAVRLICPFSFESVLSLIPSTQTVPDSVITETQFNIDSGVSVIDNRINPYLDEHYHEDITASANTGNIVLSILGTVWLTGMVLMLAYMLLSFIKIKKQMSAKIRLKDNIFICDEVKSPFIMGIFRPEIYLPSHMNEEQREYVLSHELAHLKRHDNLWKPLGFVLLSVYWFNPLMWLAYILLCRDIEAACDEKVIKNMSDDKRAGYSQALLDCGTNKKSVKVCPVAFGETGVKKRVKNVLNYKKPAFWIIIVAVIASVAVAVCFLTNPKTEEDSRNNEYLFRNNKGSISVTYICRELADEVMRPCFTLNPNNGTATFSSGSASSYLGIGKYTLNGNNLTIKADDSKYVLVFTKKGNSYILKETNYKPFNISDKAEFIPEPPDLDNVIHEVILAENKDKDWLGECYTEGHIKLGNELNGDKIKIFALTEFCSFGFENGYFTDVGGSSMPVVITIDRNTGAYSIQYPEDGEYYPKSIKKMFPPKYQSRAFGDNEKDGADMWKQCKAQAEEYLESIGRKSEVKGWGDIPRTMFTDIGMSVEISNRLEDYLETCQFYNYLGYEEIIEDGTRYVYRTSHLTDKNTLLFSKEIFGKNQVVSLFQMNIKTGDIISLTTSPEEIRAFDFIDAEVIDFKDNILTVKANADGTQYKIDTSELSEKVKPDSFYDGLYLRVYCTSKDWIENGRLIGVRLIAVLGDIAEYGLPELQQKKYTAKTESITE